jgi:hypothetical protein
VLGGPAPGGAEDAGELALRVTPRHPTARSAASDPGLGRRVTGWLPVASATGKALPVAYEVRHGWGYQPPPVGPPGSAVYTRRSRRARRTSATPCAQRVVRPGVLSRTRSSWRRPSSRPRSAATRSST